MTTQFKPIAIDRQGYILANYLPSGKAWVNGRDPSTNMGKLYRALGVELYRVEILIQTLNTELDINKTIELIRAWETSVGIPDDCFTNITDISEEGLLDRRRNILIKLRNKRLQTDQDYIDLAAEFGQEITVSSGIDMSSFQYTFPITFFGSAKEARFSIIIHFVGINVEGFTYTFPLTFQSISNSILKCLFTKIKPANCDIYFT